MKLLFTEQRRGGKVEKVRYTKDLRQGRHEEASANEVAKVEGILD